MKYRYAKTNDCALLAELNHQLIRDEGHRNPMTISQLQERMQHWLAEGCVAVLFQDGKDIVAYALYHESPEKIYLRHLFVVRNRRRQGIGRKVVGLLRAKIWPKDKRLTVDVLVHNTPSVAFWRAVGYQDYALTLEILPVVSTTSL